MRGKCWRFVGIWKIANRFGFFFLFSPRVKRQTLSWLNRRRLFYKVIHEMRVMLLSCFVWSIWICLNLLWNCCKVLGDQIKVRHLLPMPILKSEIEIKLMLNESKSKREKHLSATTKVVSQFSNLQRTFTFKKVLFTLKRLKCHRSHHSWRHSRVVRSQSLFCEPFIFEDISKIECVEDLLVQPGTFEM